MQKNRCQTNSYLCEWGSLFLGWQISSVAMVLLAASSICGLWKHLISFWLSMVFYASIIVSWCLSTTYIFNFPDSHPEVKTVVCVLSTADGPLIVLKQTCRYCESRGSCSEALGRQPEWCLETIGESIALCSCVSRLCVYCSMAPNTGKEPLIPPYLLSLISVASFRHPTK